ncbi:MAG: chorismate mutase [Candidatus Hecatellaceae archaeon]
MAERLAKLRSRISEIDREIVKLLAQRISVVPEIAEIKREMGLPLVDKQREVEVLEKVSSWAEEFKVNPAYVRCVYKAIIECTTRLEKEFYEGKP